MPERFLNLADGVAMVVSDLHGNRDAFDRCLAHFHRLHRQGKAQRLIFLGDLIHAYGPPDTDGSLSMVRDVMRLQADHGPDTVLMLLGNHEMPHIYGVTLAKGDVEFTPRFEHALGDARDEVMAFFKGLPFFVRTAAGVALGHAGPAPEALFQLATLRGFDHDAILDEADHVLAQAENLDALYQHYHAAHGVPYPELAFRYLAIQGERDPRYSHLLRGFLISQQSREFGALWNVLFTQNDSGLTKDAYANACRAFLQALSEDAPAEQRVMVSGHIPTRGGHRVVNAQHLRISTAAHAKPMQAGEYLLLDCAAPVQEAEALLPGLQSLYTGGRA